MVQGIFEPENEYTTLLNSNSFTVSGGRKKRKKEKERKKRKKKKERRNRGRNRNKEKKFAEVKKL